MRAKPVNRNLALAYMGPGAGGGGSLRAQGAATAGAWAHISQCQIPIYRFGAHTLISAYQRTGEDYSFLFDPEAARQTLLLAGFQEEDLPELIS